jgi:hypothetical protein
MAKRIMFDLLLLGAIIYAPWWVAAPLALVGAFLFLSYFEIFAFGIYVDLLYGTSTALLHGSLGVIGATLFFFVGRFIRGLVRPSYTLLS